MTWTVDYYIGGTYIGRIYYPSRWAAIRAELYRRHHTVHSIAELMAGLDDAGIPHDLQPRPDEHIDMELNCA